MPDYTGASTYPSTLDAFDSTKDNEDPIGQDLVDVRKAVVNIETELGTNPSAGESTVAAAIAAAGVSPVDYDAEVLGDSPALYWKLDGTDGANDLTANNRDGTGAGGVTIGGATGIDGEASGATDFDGTDDRITASYSPWTAATVRTCEAWIKCDVASDGSEVVFGGTGANGPQLMRRTTGSTELYSSPDNGVGGILFTEALSFLGTWQHVVTVFDDVNNLIHGYVDGDRWGSKACAVPYGATPGNLQISGNVGAFNLWDGKLCRIAVYESELTPHQIKRHYLAGISALVE